MGKENQVEVLNLNALIKSELIKENKIDSFKVDLTQPKMKLSEGRFVWMATNQKNHHTYFVFSRDQGAGAIEYTSVEIDPRNFPKLIEKFKKSGYAVELMDPAVGG